MHCQLSELLHDSMNCYQLNAHHLLNAQFLLLGVYMQGLQMSV